jgi:predicted dehydrogenase
MPERSVSVLGLGSIGMRHARNLRGRGVAVTGFDPAEARRNAAIGIGAAVVAGRAEAIAASDIVVVASPNRQHFDDLADAVAAKRHVLVEKPIAHTLDGLAPVLADAARQGLVVFCGFNLRFHPAVVAAKECLAAGAIGRPIQASIHCGSYHPLWRPNDDYRRGYAADPMIGGVVFDMIHEIDLAIHLLGNATVAAASAVRSGLLDMPSDDMADFVLVHEGGARSNVHLDYLSRPAIRETRVLGTAGVLKIDLLARRMTYCGVDGTVADERTFPGSFAEDYVAEMDAFLARVAGDRTLGATGEDGLRSLEVAIEVRRMAGLPQA